MKKVAVIGSGISGTSAAYYLNKLGYDVYLFESGSHFGGHTNTIDLDLEGQRIPVDTGFLVHNDRTYPNLIDFFEELKIETHLSEMSFSVVRRTDDITWAGTNIFTVFAQPGNLFSMRFFRFLKEVLRFNKESKKYLLEYEGKPELTLDEMLIKKGYTEDFKNWYLLPMGGCIWSSPTNEMLNFPAYTFLIFCLNHGLLQIFKRPQWKTVLNGCRTYIETALSQIDNKFLNEPVLEVVSEDNKLKLITEKRIEYFDYCLICSHPPQTLEIFKNADFLTKNLLSKFKYQKNKAVLHFDESVLPREKIAWAAWNYLSTESTSGNDKVSVSYLINKLQPLPVEKAVIVTLNPASKIEKNKVVKEINYQHPLFSIDAIRAQREMVNIQGRQGVYFSGAWLRYGFHEDGILSSKSVINKLLKDDEKNEELLRIL
ncbi:MAG: FAD-dependent oxidoreductase [SAR324 cluster bacterium]|jgi:predicted NAD/FAD-binding protein|nr:FAD-dependent oxidoreductase [SAR324 cluster bacterium]|tara:strand:+ start:1082 stop:2368 length:1287 start_codon:yes stop_codon:yes gene_type:complete